MNRLSTWYTITEIEAIVGKSAPRGRDTHHWQAEGVDCTRTRHRYSGPHYDFTIDILEMKRSLGGRVIWHAMLVSDWWRATDGTETELRSTKWLKLISGRAGDVSSWMRTARGRGEIESEPPHDA